MDQQKADGRLAGSGWPIFLDIFRRPYHNESRDEKAVRHELAGGFRWCGRKGEKMKRTGKILAMAAAVFCLAMVPGIGPGTGLLTAEAHCGRSSGGCVRQEDCRDGGWRSERGGHHGSGHHGGGHHGGRYYDGGREDCPWTEAGCPCGREDCAWTEDGCLCGYEDCPWAEVGCPCGREDCAWTEDGCLCGREDCPCAVEYGSPPLCAGSE